MKHPSTFYLIFDLDVIPLARQDVFIKVQETAAKHKLKRAFL